jgi:hypothetical protein
MITDRQGAIILNEMSKHQNIQIAANKAGVCCNTVRKYHRLGKYPSETKQERNYRTRNNPFKEDMGLIIELLKNAPELRAKTIFDYLLELEQDYSPGQIRTLQRIVKDWKIDNGPEKEIFFDQKYRPGEIMQVDFTRCKSLGITINREPFEFMLFHAVLPYSNWTHAKICYGETFTAIKAGLREALKRLGRKPEFLQIDNSSAATHSEKNDSKDTATQKGSKFSKTDNQKEEENLKIPSSRKFNQDFMRLMDSVGIIPRTTGIGAKEQNGDIESYNGHLKSRIKQYLLIRGSCDFKSVEEVQKFVQKAVDKSNHLHEEQINAELKTMESININHLKVYSELRVKVRKNSTISVKGHLYSVSSRLIGCRLKVKLYEDRLEIYYKQKLKQKSERIHKKGKHNLKYQHMVRSLVKKPGAFIRMSHQQYMFPNLNFRKTYDSLLAKLSERRASLEYLRILKLCLEYGESEVEEALQLLMEEHELPDFTRVKELITPWKHEFPQQEVLKPELLVYDGLLMDTNINEMIEGVR